MTSPADLELAVAVPRHWRTRADPDRGVVLAARAPSRAAGGFAPELVLRTHEPEDPTAPAGGELAGADLEDVDEFSLHGRPVRYRRLARRVGSTDVVTEQWTWLATAGATTAVTLTASVARCDYADYCDLFEEVAASVVLNDLNDLNDEDGPGSARPDGGRW